MTVTVGADGVPPTPVLNLSENNRDVGLSPVLLPEGPFSHEQAVAVTTAYAMCLLKMTRERISGWLYVMRRSVALAVLEF